MLVSAKLYFLLQDDTRLGRSHDVSLPDKALHPGSVAKDKLLAFLAYLTEWELHAGGGGGFLSPSTAVGLRVSISSVRCLLDYDEVCKVQVRHDVNA